MNKIKLFIALLIGLIASATTMAQTVNMSSYITLTVTKDAAIRLNLKAAVTNTPIRIVSGSNTQDITVGTAWTGKRVYNADGTNMTIYGDLTGFDCSVNVAKLTALDASKNTQLTVLSCSNNQLTALDVSKNTQLTMLFCSNNQLSSLDVSRNTHLATLYCYNNQLTALDVSKNTQLTTLFCYDNQLTTLDVSRNTHLATLFCSNNQLTSLDISKNTQLAVLDCSKNQLTALDVSRNTQLTTLFCYNNHFTILDVLKNTALTELDCSKNQLIALDVSKNMHLATLFCYNNQLTSLDISKNMQLAELDCYDNNFSTAALDAIYCALPVREAVDKAKIHPVYDASSANHATVLATNKQNAIDKNWKVQYYADNTDIPTTGSYVCPATDIAEATADQQLTLYPNPVGDMLYLSATARTIHIYNMYGTEVLRATDTDRIAVSNLLTGVYTVKADGTVVKMVKR
jgi:cell wall surface anchor family protein